MVASCAVLLSIGVTSIPTGRAGTAPTDALRARRAQLLQQLAALASDSHSGVSALVQAEQAVATEQDQLLAAQRHLSGLNSRLLALTSHLASDRATIDAAKHQLQAMTRQSYKSTVTDSWVAAVLSASSFSQAVDHLTSTSQVSEQVRNRQSMVRDTQKAMAAAKAEIQTDVTSSTAAESLLAKDSNTLLVLVEQRNLALQGASGPARALAAQIAEIDQELAGGATPAPRASSPPCGDHFAYGQCTWYVASRRCIPWVGNAQDWYGAAARYGYPEGRSPQVGAVVVFPPGGDSAGPVGHVAYVEAVGPASGVPAGYFKISEMNFNGWDRVDYRILADNSSGIDGFIYAR
ncbi:MAG: CHAP domain-containing protein [Candidatus Dormibacteraeota bacterium]|uniref:CHAP domain-containing protein n=1 Tax=Candidatus Aeolococcus gillhamiae TaxID=3127015 RepID=A0A934JXZ3_9BACT|nr:CHAP domain-containing protein [Candidatus Dormibacteraeota bacterium]